MPFRLIAGRIVTEAMVDDRPAVAIVDTGAPISLVRSEITTPPAHQRGRRAIFQSEHGPVMANLAGPLRVSIGDLTRTLPTVMILPGQFLAETGVDADVVIGQDVLSATTLEIDFERHRLRLRDRSWRPGPGFVVLPLIADDGRRLVIDLDIASVGRVPAIVDLGSNAALAMDAGFVRRHDLANGLPTSSGLFATLGGLSETLAFSLPSFDIGGVPVVEAPVDAIPNWSSPQPINVGVNVLRRFHLVLDLARAELALRPIPDVGFEREMSGVLFAHRGTYLDVVHVARRSPAETAGVRCGDRIKAINDVSVTSNYFNDDQWRWRYGPRGAWVKLMTPNGEHCLRLERYY